MAEEEKTGIFRVVMLFLRAMLVRKVHLAVAQFDGCPVGRYNCRMGFLERTVIDAAGSACENEPPWQIRAVRFAGTNQVSGVTLMECKKAENLDICNCSYEPCSRKGMCCECISYHLRIRQLPACCFPDDAERTYDRSFEHFAKLVARKSI